MTTPVKRTYFTVKKIISIFLILFIIYMVTGFFLWYYVTAPTIPTEGQVELFAYIQPFLDFFKPSTDFYAWAWDAWSHFASGK